MNARPAALALIALVLAGAVPSGSARAAGPAADAVTDVATVAAHTFTLACVGHIGDPQALRDRLRPGHDLYLPQLPAAEAAPFLQGRDGDAWVRPDFGIALALLRPDESCVVFVRKVAAEALYRRLDADLRAALGVSFTVKPGGEERKGPMRSRFLDLSPSGDYRSEMVRRHGREPPGFRVILTTSDTANPNLQAIISIGTRE